uniref:Peptidase_M16_C domain-containing protein n=1 Tax=Trichobilharzia regenti TaxID=157069 RepID=A0AA85IQU0_TRIRE|nr:unnamed protein product [Trichobilharzia regenti]
MCNFLVSIELTDYGRDHIFRVCSILFDYIKILLHSATSSLSSSSSSGSNANSSDVNNLPEMHTFATYLPEYQLTREASFLYKEPSDAEDTVVTLANKLHLVKPEHVYSGYQLLKKPNMQLYIDLLKLMTPERAAIFFLSSSFAASVSDESKLDHEPWFNVAYRKETIPDNIMNDWKTSKPSGKLHLPYKNNFITTDFSLLDPANDMKQPKDLNLEPGGESRLQYGHLWFQQSTRFKCPKANVAVHLWSGLVTKTKENVALHGLMVFGFNHSLSTITYEASEAGLEQDVRFGDTGLCIHVSGFNEKLFSFYSTVLDHIMDQTNDLSKEYFESYRDATLKLYYNQALKPDALNTHLQFYLLRREVFLLTDLLNTLKDLSVADLAAYKQQFFSNLHITVYAYGNIRKEDAINFFDYTVKKINPVPIPKRKLADPSILDPGTYHLRLMNCNPSDVNMCLARVHLLGESDIKSQCYNKLLAFILSEPAFDYLRTKESLGYTIYLQYWLSMPGSTSHSGISLIACSPASKFSVNFVAGRLTAFWRRIAPRIIAAMPPENFKTSVESLISIYQLEDPNMVTEFDRNWDEIMQTTANFNYREECVKILSTITQESLLSFFLTEYLDTKKQRSLFIQIDSTATPDMNANTNVSSNSYLLNFDVIQTDDKSIKEEYTSYSSVDVTSALTTCGYDDKLVNQFFDNHKSNHDNNNNNPLDKSLLDKDEPIVYINNLFKFRSNLQFKTGRIA